jgi:hypothetical protein
MSKYGLAVTGKIRVFAKDKEVKGKGKKKYTITDVWFNVSEQEEDGSYFNRSMNLIFKKEMEKPTNNSLIELEGFPIITGNDDYRKIALFVNGWNYAEAEDNGKK